MLDYAVVVVKDFVDGYEEALSAWSVDGGVRVGPMVKVTISGFSTYDLDCSFHCVALK